MMTPNLNKSIDEKYEIIHEIKKGGFGIVYYGVDKKLNKPVAIKEIAQNLLADPKYLDMFQEEALNIAKLSHNNIVHIYELKKLANGHIYIVMEYIDGIDLEKIIRNLRKQNRQIPAHLAVFIISEICMALDYAHQRRDAFTNKPLNLVHQDISPSNIMISRFGGIKLIDFGIASVKRYQQKEKKDNKLRGKIPYMAPEQLLMGNHPDHRSDLFSLGLVLYETLTGERLFNSQEEVVAAGKNAKLFRKTLKNKKLPGALFKIISKALEIDISKRYQNANHMYIDLLQYLISCNETGELMDQLAGFIGQQFDNRTPLPEATPFTSSPEKIDRQSPPSPVNSYMPNPVDTDSLRYNPVSEPLDYSQPLLTDNVNQTQFQTISTMELDAEDEDLKTVIDVIRISARNNKRRIFTGLFAAFIILIVLGTLDIMNGWTQAGLKMYDWIFPPAVHISSVPPNAEVYLDDQKLEGRSPLGIDKITPGPHKLELRLSGYKPIIKSLFVPGEGAIRVQGISTDETDHDYLFRFNTEIEISSNPPGADVFVNGIRYNRKTPCTISWEAGTPFSLELQRPGFNNLTGYSLNTVEGYDEVDDRRFWDLKVLINDYTKYAVTGIFRKAIIINTVPDGVEIIDVKTNRSLGKTGSDKILLLQAGTHELELQKPHFLAKKIQLTVNENTRDKIRAVMSRNIRFSSIDQSASGKQDIGAELISLKSGSNEYLRKSRRTPLELSLPAYTYKAVFSKPGFKSRQVAIGPETNSVKVALEPLKATIKITVIDALTEQVVPGAEIYFNGFNQPKAKDTFLTQTNTSGEGTGDIQAGNYTFKILKAGYNSEMRNIVTKAGDSQNYIVELYPSN